MFTYQKFQQAKSGLFEHLKDALGMDMHCPNLQKATPVTLYLEGQIHYKKLWPQPASKYKHFAWWRSNFSTPGKSQIIKVQLWVALTCQEKTVTLVSRLKPQLREVLNNPTSGRFTAQMNPTHKE